MRISRTLTLCALGAATAVAGVTASGGSAVPACGAGEAVLISDITKVSGPGTAPTLLACHSSIAGAVFLRTYDGSDSEDIAATGVTDDTVLRMQVTLPAGATTINTILVGWASSVERSGSTLTITASPRIWSFAGNGRCVPGACDVETAEQTWNSYLSVQVNLPGRLPADINALLDGSWVSTGANAFGVMPGLVSDTGATCGTPSPTCQPSMQIAMAGPHRHANGALNRAYFRAFLPANLVQTFMGGVSAADLGLIRQEASTAAGTAVSGMQCNPVSGGILCTYDVPDAHFSAPTYSIRKASTAAGAPPAAGAAPSGPRLLGAVRSARAKATKRSVRVTWRAPAGATATQRYRVVLRNKKKSATKTVAGTSTTFAKLAPGTWRGTVTPVSGTGSLNGAPASVSVRVR